MTVVTPLLASNINILNRDQMMATSQCNISQHCWPSNWRFQPNHCNIWTQQSNRSQYCWAQHVVLIWPACCNMLWHVVVGNQTSAHAQAQHCWTNLAKWLQHHAHPQMLHEKFDHFQIWVNNTQHVPTCSNKLAKHKQHVAPINIAICCVEMFGHGFTFCFACWYTCQQINT